MAVHRVLRPGDVRLVPDELYDDIATHYPDGRAWAARRIPQAADGHDVHAHVAVDAGAIVGLVLVVPKGARTKIATVWVDRAVRRRRVATTLLARAVAPYADTTLYATAPASTRAVFAPLFAVHAMTESVCVADRYGHGRDEIVFTRPPVPADVRALSLARPWADLVVSAGKNVENRTWTTRWRGLLAIHASKSWRPEAAVWCRERDLPGPERMAGRTGFIGVARLVGIDCTADTCGCACSPWAMGGSHHWRLVSPWSFGDPADAAGKVGLWRPGDDIAHAAIACIARRPAV